MNKETRVFIKGLVYLIIGCMFIYINIALMHNGYKIWGICGIILNLGLIWRGLTLMDKVT